MGSFVGSVLMRLGGLAASDSDEVSVQSITLFVGILCICIVIGFLLEENRWINQSVNALLIGLGSGIIVLLCTKGTRSRFLRFNEELFMLYLLPAIIFNAGFQVKKKQFFRNFMTIMLFGVVGTIISFCIVSLGTKVVLEKLGVSDLKLHDYLAIGAIFSATDSLCTLQVLNQDKTPLLYSLVFGEGVVNDATSIVIFHAIKKSAFSDINSRNTLKFFGYLFTLFITSTLLGVLAGLICAYIIKKLYFGRHSTDREFALMILMAYLSYTTAELFGMSGILAVFFCGIVMSHYTWHNVTQSSQITTKHAFATLSFIAETFIFLYVGMDALDIGKWKHVSKSLGTFIGASAGLFGLVLVGRACFVFPLCFLLKLTMKSRSDKLSFKHQATFWWAGLMRGAVSMALAYNKFSVYGYTMKRGHAIVITSTITVVLFTMVVFGSLTKHLIRFLLSRSNQDGEASSQPSSSNSTTLPLLGNRGGPEDDGSSSSTTAPRPSSLKMLLSAPTSTVHYYWRNSMMHLCARCLGAEDPHRTFPARPEKKAATFNWCHKKIVKEDFFAPLFRVLHHSL